MKPSTLFVAMFLCLVSIVSYAIAQDTPTPTPDPDTPIIDAGDIVMNPYEQLGSISGIITLTLILVQIVKHTTGKWPFFKDMPTWLYCICIAEGLVLVAFYGLHTLEGDLFTNLWQGFFAAGAASGIFSWGVHLDATPETKLLDKGR